jgi:hypothetical protein
MKRFLCILFVLAIVSLYGCAGMTETQIPAGLAVTAGSYRAVGGVDFGLIGHMTYQPIITPRVQSPR